ncbi:uncharacterized protein N0V89_003480 [Didymosphaeria variabile]|uniref:GPI anchored protein n=1 Tax=Didymosphaeria variabile TaxID=1932322 RepID=A0A9W9CBI9_9PLEO|nr:uncharacterized protein N0V89_003480 [Didymosphaeria variabile]KAJ4355464.1 hypothetical protein N0V89_003480 [Didymosphaeria variabile]
MASLFTFSTLLSLALAQTTTIKLPFIGYDDMTIHASVVSAKPSQTVFALACPTGTDGSECGLFPQQLLTYGPSIYVMDMSEPGDEDFSMTQDCSIGVATATCKESASGSEANFPGSSTETYEDITRLPVTITAGAEKLAASADATPTPDASSKGSSSAVATTGGSASATMATSTRAGASASNSSSVAPAESTGAADRSMGSNVGLVGVAAAGVFAGLLL